MKNDIFREHPAGSFRPMNQWGDFMKFRKIPVMVVIFCLLFSAAALAQPEDTWFDTGKEALALLSYKEYGQALSLLQMTDVAPEAFAASMESDFRTLFRGTVQTDVAVLFSDGDGKWYLAIPVTEPSDDRVETMVFSLGSGQRCTDVSCMTWGEVMEAVDKSTACTWNMEYMPGSPILETDA